MIEKLLIAVPAAILTAGVIANRPDELKLDPDIADPATQAENLLAWEVYRIFYHAIRKTLDSADWPAAAVNLGGLVGTAGPVLMQGLQTLMTGTGPLALLVQQLIKAIPVPSPATIPPVLPNGGELK